MCHTAAVRALHELPEDALHAIMSKLSGNDAVRLGSLNSAMRRALGMLPNLHPSVVLDLSQIRGRACTRNEAAPAEQPRQRRSESFGAFRAAYPGVAVTAPTVRLVSPNVVPPLVPSDAISDLRWLP